MPEVRRLMAALAGTPDRLTAQRRWSRWRRAHQATACRYHRERRARRSPPASVDLGVVAVPGTPALTDAAWARAAPLLPPGGRPGKPWRDHRAMLAGILWVMRTGASWREMPRHHGPWQSAHSRYARWRREGTWARLLGALLPPADAAALGERA